MKIFKGTSLCYKSCQNQRWLPPLIWYLINLENILQTTSNDLPPDVTSSNPLITPYFAWIPASRGGPSLFQNTKDSCIRRLMIPSHSIVLSPTLAVLDQFALYKQVKEALNTLFCFDKWHSKWFLQLILWIETRGSMSPLLFVNSRGLPFWFYDACMSNDMLSISHLLFADDTYICKIRIIFVTWDVYFYVSKSFQDLCG